MPLSQGVTRKGCVSAQDRASTHTDLSQSEHPSEGGVPLYFNISSRGKLTAVLDGVFQQLPTLQTHTWLSGSACPAQLQPLQPGTSLGSLSTTLSDLSGHHQQHTCALTPAGQTACSQGWSLHVKHTPALQGSRKP